MSEREKGRKGKGGTHCNLVICGEGGTSTYILAGNERGATLIRYSKAVDMKINKWKFNMKTAGAQSLNFPEV